MKEVVKYVVIGVIVCILSCGGTIGYFELQNTVEEKTWMGIEGNIKGTNVILSCELPSKRPILPILSLESEEVTNKSVARDLALEYFPEFRGAEFIDIDNEEVEFMLEKEDRSAFLDIYRSGALSYTKRQGMDIVMNTTEFTKEEALNLSKGFILNHGGFGDFELDSVGTWAELDKSGNPTGLIKAYIFQYRQSYNGTPISGPGGNAIKTIVTCDGNVTDFFRLARVPTEAVSMVRVISATQAFNALKKAYKVNRDITIIKVDVCYYSAHYEEKQETMEPAWRFEIGGKSGEKGEGYLYVNAVSGEPILCLKKR